MSESQPKADIPICNDEKERKKRKMISGSPSCFLEKAFHICWKVVAHIVETCILLEVSQSFNPFRLHFRAKAGTPQIVCNSCDAHLTNESQWM